MAKQNLHTELITLCDYASISREGKLSINGIFDEVRVQKFPGGLARAFLVATVNGTPDTSYKLNLKIETKNNKNVSPSLGSTILDTVTGSNGRNNLIIELMSLAFEKEGEYEFKLYEGENVVGSTLLRVLEVSKNKPLEYKLPN